MSENQFTLVYVTYETIEQARDISGYLVSEHLVACANILSPHESIYWWEDKIQSSLEVAVIYKTREDLFDLLTAKIVSKHSYTCPCIVSLPITGGHMPFLKWIDDETLDH